MGRFDLFLGHLRVMAAALALTGALMMPAVALADEPAAGAPIQHGVAAGDDPAPAGSDHAEAGAEGEHSAGLPQLNSHTFPSQIFWLITAFATLYYLLSKRALPRVGEILEARQERIASDLDRAAALRAEAEEAMRRHEQVVAEAHAEASAKIKATQERMQAEATKRQAEIEADLNGKLAEAEQRIASAKGAALAQVETVAVEVAQSAVERLAGMKLPEQDVAAALRRAMAEAA